MSEKRPWTEEEDRLLKFVFDTSKLTKWSHIARRLQEEFGVKGRNGKQCKERYICLHLGTLPTSTLLIPRKNGATKKSTPCSNYITNSGINGPSLVPSSEASNPSSI